VTKPDPQIGDIVRYDYLWRDEQKDGRQEGRKDRPCAVIVARRRTDTGAFEILLAPITHTPPRTPSMAIAIPVQAKGLTGLDDNRSWLLTSEVNQVAWSDAGIVPAAKGKWLYGSLPRGLAMKAVFDIKERRERGDLAVVDRREGGSQNV
jgi:mRNA-degrading endonuclease toxin of MazEF toxin-antitoxin module